MLECEAHHHRLDGFADPPAGWWWPNSTRFTLRRPVMVDPNANGADIEIPVLTGAKADQIALVTPGRHRAGLAKLVNLPAA